MKKITLLFILCIFSYVTINAQDSNLQKAQNYIASKGEVCITFTANTEAQVQEISSFLTIGHKVNRQTLEIEAYANRESFSQFLAYGLPYEVHTTENEFSPHDNVTYNVNAWDTTWDQYPTYSQYVAKMNYYATTYPELCTLQTIGTTPRGRALLVLKISDNVNLEEAEPEFLYTSSMHGNELTGFPLMIRLIDYLLTNYGSNSEVTNIINSTELFINPLANPDGAYGNTGSNTISGPTRENANNVDLNRNFPDNLGGIHDDGRVYQPETKAFMAFEASRDFVLAANFHGGTEVVNYPYDNTTTVKHADHNYYEYISVEYAQNCQSVAPANYMNVDYDSGTNPASPGVTQGSIWYTVTGGRQDYMNFYRHGKEVTVEISDVKAVAGNQLPNHWNYNRQAFLDYIKQANFGFQGKVLDSSGNPINAQIFINGHDKLNSYVFSNPDHGDYYRLIESGTYQVTYSAPGYVSQNVTVSVSNNATTVQNVTLVSLTPLPTSSNAEVCTDENIELTASGSGALNWYSTSTATSPLFTGANYTTPTLTSTTSYYVEDVIAKANVGSTQTNANGSFLGGNGRYLTFNCSESVMLNEVTINAQQSGDIEVQLQNSSGAMLDSRIISLSTSGLQTIPLNFIVPIGNNLRLAAKELSNGLNLYRNNVGTIGYPFTNGSITITGSSASQPTNFYYFFYDWKIAPLKSARQMVTVTVNPKPEANFTFEVSTSNNGEVTFTNTSGDASTYSWNFGDSIGSSSAENPTYTFTASGTYNVSLTSTNPNCGDDVIIIPVTVTVETLAFETGDVIDFSIYPNPFSENITIKVVNNGSTTYTIELYDVSGRSIMTQKDLTPVDNRIDLSLSGNLSQGTYFMKLTDNITQKQMIKRLIKE